LRTYLCEVVSVDVLRLRGRLGYGDGAAGVAGAAGPVPGCASNHPGGGGSLNE
jgi:hypothetical protein